jgi:hypothetical protein
VAYGVKVDGFDFGYGMYSVIQKGLVTGTFNITLSSHPDVTEWRVVFIPVGVRSTQNKEVRPSFLYLPELDRITISKPPLCSAHEYIVLGR